MNPGNPSTNRRPSGILAAGALTNSSAWVQDCAAWGLAQFGAEARMAAPAILPLLQRPNDADRCITVLERIDPKAAAGFGSADR